MIKLGRFHHCHLHEFNREVKGIAGPLSRWQMLSKQEINAIVLMFEVREAKTLIRGNCNGSSPYISFTAETL